MQLFSVPLTLRERYLSNAFYVWACVNVRHIHAEVTLASFSLCFLFFWGLFGVSHWLRRRNINKPVHGKKNNNWKLVVVPSVCFKESKRTFPSFLIK